MYTGNVSITNGGRICQSWTSQTPHSHLFIDDLFFPLDSSVEGAANYCRNTGQETDDSDRRPWCFTIDPRKPRDYCNKPICGGVYCVDGGRGYGRPSVARTLMDRFPQLFRTRS